MSTVAEIQSAIIRLSRKELDELEAWWHPAAGHPGARLKRLVADARSGEPGIPKSVSLVSDQPLTDRAVQRSKEMIQQRGWDV